MRILTCLVLLASAASASSDAVNRAAALYQHTEFENSLRVLALDATPDNANDLLTGKNYFMLGDFKKSVEFFEKTLAAAPRNSEAELWLGRAWGRRAEGSPLVAIVYASRARECFEKAVALDPSNREAKNDLFDFYLNAPGVLGGGLDKAEAAARGIATDRPAEFEFEEAQIADKRNNPMAAEKHLRRAMELAPEPGRIVDLARWLAKHGRLAESDQLFERADKLAPGKPGVIFAEAKSDIENHRNMEKARKLLQGYLQASLTPDDPPRREAEKLLRRAGE